MSEVTWWATGALNRIAITSNGDRKSPYEISHGGIAPLQLRPFMKLGFYHRKRARKNLTKAISCFCMGPAPHHQSDDLHVLTNSRELVTTRDVTWLGLPANVPPALEMRQLNDATHQGTQSGWQENIVSNHYSEEEDKASWGTEKSNI